MISIKEIEKLAELSRLDLTIEEKESFRKDMDSILEYVKQIQQVSSVAEGVKEVPLHRNILRDDTDPHESGIYTEKLISVAPKREGNYIKVKKIL